MAPLQACKEDSATYVHNIGYRIMISLIICQIAVLFLGQLETVQLGRADVMLQMN